MGVHSAGRGWWTVRWVGAKWPHPATTTTAGPAQVDMSTLPELIGYKVLRYWPSDGGWCEGVVTDMRERDGFYW